MESLSLETGGTDTERAAPKEHRPVASTLILLLAGALCALLAWNYTGISSAHTECLVRESIVSTTWSAVTAGSYELWDFEISNGDAIANGLLSPDGMARDFANKKGVAQLSYKRAPDGVDAAKPVNICPHPGKVFTKTHFNAAKAQLTGKKPINLVFETPFFGMKRMALNPVYGECTGIVELVAARLYQDAVGFGPGAAPVRLFHDGKFLGLYTAIEWVTDDSFLDRAFPGARGNATQRVWEGRDHSSLEYVGTDPALYKQGCHEQGCPYCKSITKVGDRSTCDYSQGVGEDCQQCPTNYSVYQDKFCCVAPKLRSNYEMTLEEPKQESQDNGFSELEQLVTLIHLASKSEQDQTTLEARFNVPAMLQMMAVDVMIGNYDGFWGSGNNYFLHQSGANASKRDMGYWTLFQIDMDMMFCMPPEGGQWGSDYTIAWRFPTGLSMCCMPWKEITWPNLAREHNGVLDKLLLIPKYHAIFIERLRKMVDRGTEIAGMFREWSRITFPSRKAELAVKPHWRWSITLKTLQTCNPETVQAQLELYIEWVGKREAYLRKELAKLPEVAGHGGSGMFQM